MPYYQKERHGDSSDEKTWVACNFTRLCRKVIKKISRRKPVIKNRVEEHIEQAVVQMAIDNPALVQVP